MNQYHHQKVSEEELAAIFYESDSKYNTSIILSDSDARTGVKIFCKESYDYLKKMIF